MLALLFSLAFQQSFRLEPLPAGSTNVGAITSVAARDQLVMLQALKGPEAMNLYRLNLQSRLIERVEGSGLPKTIYRLMPLKQGFAVYGHLVQRIYELDDRGALQTVHELADFEGALPEMVVAEVFAWTPGTALLSFETEDSDALFLARLDLEAHKLTVLGNFPGTGEGSFQFAFALGERFLLCDKASGRVRWIQADGKPLGAELQAAMSLEKTPQFGDAEAADKLSARLKYRARITDPLPCADGFSFVTISRFATAMLGETRNTRLAGGPDQPLRSVDLLTLHRHGGQRLVWDLVSGNLMFLNQ